MARCPKPGCDSDTFKVEYVRITGSNQPYPMIVCSNCGTLITFSPERIEKALEELLKAK